MKGTMKKIISVVLALVMVITGLQYSPSTTVKAMEITTAGYTYSISGVSGTIVGFTNNGNNNNAFNFAWNGDYATTVDATISGDGLASTPLKSGITNGGSITIAEITAIVNTEGTYTISFVGNGGNSNPNNDTTATATLTIAEAAAPEPIVDGTELIPVAKQNSGILSIPTYEGGNPYDNEYKVENLNIVENVWYVAKYTITSDVQKWFELRLQNSSGWSDYSRKGVPAQQVQVNAGETVTQTLVFQANQSTNAGVFDICMGKINNVTANAATVQITNISLKTYSTQAAAEAATAAEITTPIEETSSVETSTEEPTLNWQTDANLTAYFGSGARYAYVTSNPGNGDDKFLGGTFTIHADKINITAGAHGVGGTGSYIKLNGTQVDETSADYALNRNCMFSQFHYGINTIQFIGNYTAGNSNLNVEFTLYVDVPDRAGNFMIDDYSAYTGKYIAKFDNIGNTISKYDVYVDGVKTDITLSGSGDFFTVADLEAEEISPGSHTVTITGEYANGNETIASVDATINVPASAGTNGDIAQIYIQTDNTSLSPIEQESKTVIDKVNVGKQAAAITVIDKDGVQNPYKVCEDAAKTTVKVRGNSTAGAVKKAYNITFNSGRDLFGLDGSASPAKKWSLLANAFDKSLIRNYLGFDIAHHVWADNATPDYNSQCKFVDLYFNGVYMGNYLLIESVETGAGRVNIDSQNASTYNTEALLELEEIHAIGEEANFTTSRYEQTFIFGSPETADDIGGSTSMVGEQTFFEKKQADVADIFNDFEDDLYAAEQDPTNETKWNAVLADIDLTSFVKFYLVSEIMTTKDFNQSSTRFYVHNGKIYGGPLWDMDYSSDNNLDNPVYTREYQRRMPWFDHLMNIPAFKTAVVNEYRSIRPYVMSLYANNGGIDTLVTSIAGSASRNYSARNNGGAGWSINTADTGDSYGYMQMITNGVAGATAYTSYNAANDSTSAVAQVKNYFQERIAGLDETWDVSYDATIDTTGGEVVVSWDAMEGTTGYRLTFSGKYTAPGAPEQALVQQIDDDYTAQTVDVPAGTTSYNLTTNGYEVEDGTDITVAYSTDSGSTYTTLDTVTYNAPVPEPEVATISLNASAVNYRISATWANPTGTAHAYAYLNSVAPGKSVIAANNWDFNTQAEQPMTGVDTVSRTRDSSVTVEYGNTYTIIVEAYDSEDNLIGRGEAEVTIPNASQEEILKNRVGQLDNLARNKTPMVGSNSGAANNLVDGNTGNRWQADKAVDNTYFGVDLGAVYSIDRVLVCWENSYATAYTVQVSTDGESYTTVDTVSGVSGNNPDKLSTFEPIYARYVKIVATTLSGNATAYGMSAYELAVFGGDITPGVNDSGWVQVPNSSHYWYYVPNNYSFNVNTAGATMQGMEERIYFPFYGQINTTPKSATLGSTDLTNTGNAQVWLPTSLIASNNTVYKLTFVDNDDEKAVVYFKKQTEANYTPTGIAITQAGVMTWTPSADATTAGATYSVTFNGSTTNNISTGTTTLDLTGVAYGEYNVVLKTYVAGSEVDSQTVSFKYKDPEVVDSTLHKTGNNQIAWEKERCDYLSWDAVAGHTYAVYVDGKLWEDEITETSYKLPAYALVDTENGTLDKNDQAQTRGTHSVSVVAIPTEGTAPALFENVNSKKVIGTDNFTLNLNYIYGDGTDIWNDTGVPSKWNFTITPEDGETSGLKATYNNDGSVSITNIESAAEWKAKAAIYDRHLNVEDVGGLVNISFDLTITDGDIINSIRENPGSLKIGIKCVADEIANDNGNYTYAGKLYGLTQDQINAGLRWVYQDPRNVDTEPGYDATLDGPAAEYPFVYDEQTGTAVLHYSFTFTPVLDTYDLLFDLEGLEGASMTLSDAVAKDVYKVTEAIGSPIPNGSDITDSSIQVGWNSNVPDHLSGNYYYKVYIDDTLESANATLNASYSGYNAGEHTVKVESYYGLPAGPGQEETGVKTGEATATVNIVQEEKPNLVISDISIPGGVHYIGDTITVNVKIKNIGNAVADPNADNLIVWLYKKSVNDASETSLDYKTVIDRGVEDSIAVDEERTVSWQYTLTQNESIDDLGIVSFRAVVDPEAHIAELSEADNEKVGRFKFYEHVKVLNLTNDGTNVKATWPAITGTPDGAEIVYTTADNIERTVPISTAATEYTFPAALKNNTSVTVKVVYGTDEVNYAQGTALADLVATSVDARNGNAIMDVDNDIVFTVKNQGTAQAVTDDLVIWASDGASWTKYKEGIVIDLEPNETITDYVTGYHPTTTGEKTLNYKVDERNTVVESNEENNISTFTVSVIEIPMPDLVITSLTTDKTAYKVGDVIHVTMVMTNVGNADAVTGGGNIVEKLRINGTDGAYSTEGITTLDVNDTIEYEFTYTVVAADYERGYIDIAGHADADNNVAEGTAGEANNISENVRVKVVDSGTVTLTNTNDVVSASWNAGASATGYKISYTSNGTVYTEVIDTTSGNPNATLADGTYTYTFSSSRPLDHDSYVEITATYDETITGESTYYDYAKAQAKADLIITAVTSNTQVYKVKVPFTLTATVKNIGTAQVMPGTDDMEHYSTWLGINMPAVGQNIEQVIGTHTVAGLPVGSTVNLQIQDINVKAQGDYNIVINADDLGYDQQAGVGHINELDETNNSYTFPVTVIFEQQPMDWTPFYTSQSVVNGEDVYTNGNKEAKGNVSNLPDGTKVVSMNNGSDWRPIEFKVIDTNIADMDYEDIVTTWESYGGQYTQLSFNNNYQMIQYNTPEQGQAATCLSKFEFAQVSATDIENYDFATDDITYTTRHAGDGLIQTFNGNGWQFHTRSFAAGKYYIAKITNINANDTENYIVVAFKVPGDSGVWIKAQASDNSDPDQVPLLYHNNDNTVNGSIYYDAEDLGLAGITVYNGNHIAITTDGSCTMNSNAWHMTIQYAHLDENDEFVPGIASDDLDEIGNNPGEIRLDPTAEIFGLQGANTILIKFPEMIEDLPIHSPEGGNTDNEYYLLKVYYDDTEHTGSYVNIPIRMVANIPEIDEPQNVSVWSGTDAFYVSFTETNHQLYHDYSYTFYIGETKVTGVKKDGVALTNDTATEGGIYELPVDAQTKELLQIDGSEFTIGIKAEWCQQETMVTQEYTVDISDGTVDIEGFQVNTNNAEGGVSEYMPTFRVVAHSSKQFLGTEGAYAGKAVATVETGLIYAQTELADTEINSTTMVLDSDNAYISSHAAQNLHGWGGLEVKTNYFSLTMKEMEYNYNNLQKHYSFRAYAILEDGTVKYGEHIYTVSTYEIAKYLYDNEMMSTETAHNFLYDQILNVVKMCENSKKIANAMNKALTPQYGTIDRTTYQRYIQDIRKDFEYYANGVAKYGYTYSNREHNDFTSVLLGEEKQAALLAALNDAQDADYDTIFDWIVNEVSNYSNAGVAYEGFYPQVEYSWGKAISNAYTTE